MEGEESLAEHYRKRAAKAREIFKSAEDPALLEHLESVAREYDEMADKLEAADSG